MHSHSELAVGRIFLLEKKLRTQICVTLSKFLAYFKVTVCRSPLLHAALIPALVWLHAAMLIIKWAHTQCRWCFKERGVF